MSKARLDNFLLFKECFKIRWKMPAKEVFRACIGAFPVHDFFQSWSHNDRWTFLHDIILPMLSYECLPKTLETGSSKS